MFRSVVFDSQAGEEETGEREREREGKDGAKRRKDGARGKKDALHARMEGADVYLRAGASQGLGPLLFTRLSFVPPSDNRSIRGT